MNRYQIKSYLLTQGYAGQQPGHTMNNNITGIDKWSNLELGTMHEETMHELKAMLDKYRHSDKTALAWF